MYVYDIVRYTRDKDEAEISDLIGRLRIIQAREGSRYAVWSFLKEVGVYPLEVYDESYYAKQLDFELGMLMAHAGLSREASQALSGIGAANGGDFVYSEHYRQFTEFYQQQAVAASRGMVTPIITSLPKSGSATLTQTLAKLMGAPIVRLSAGHFPDFALVKAWVEHWKRGGMVNHDHFAATAHNLAVLQQAGISRLVVQVRDPRAAAWSHLAMRRNQGEEDGFTQKLEDLFSTVYQYNIQWLRGWLDAARSSPELTIQWVKFHYFTGHIEDALASIIEPLAKNRAMRKVLQQCRKGNVDIQMVNFNTGNDDTWRSHASAALQKRMWQALPQQVISLLDLKP